MSDWKEALERWERMVREGAYADAWEGELDSILGVRAHIEGLEADKAAQFIRAREWAERCGQQEARAEAAEARVRELEAGWIACSERLPERDGLGAVLAFDADHKGRGVWLETTHPSWWGQFMEGANEWGPTITHWRPLPAPPAIDTAMQASREGR